VKGAAGALSGNCDGPIAAGEGWRMKRWIMAAAAAVALAAFSGVAQATDVVWVTDQVKWATGAHDSTGNGDWTFLADEVDTTRTNTISTGSWAWEIFYADPTSPGNQAVAYLTFVAEATDGQADSIYYCVEKGYRGIYQRNNTLAAAAGQVAVLQGIGLNPAGQVWQGVLLADIDAQSTSTSPFLAPEFRLVVFGDQSGTTPAAAKLRCYITYPKRAQSR
jgi:hypothetical protein